MLGIKKQTIDLSADTLQSVFYTVRDAPAPINRQRIAQEADVIDGPTLEAHLSTLLQKFWIEIAYQKTGMDGIVRPFYRVSAAHDLKEVKTQIGSFMAKLQDKLKPFVDDGTFYAVRVYNHKELSMVFNKREEARDYKSLLTNSHIDIKSEIFYQKFEGGYQTEERKTS